MKIALTYHVPISHVNRWLLAIILVLLGLWISALADQGWNFATFKSGMLRHSFPNWVGHTLIWVLPALEVAVIALLVNPRTMLYGMWLSTLLMFGFTVYNGLGVMTDWVSFECGCSKLISKLSWWGHFWFNLTLFIVSGIGIYLAKLQRGSEVGDMATKGGSAKRRDT